MNLHDFKCSACESYRFEHDWKPDQKYPPCPKCGAPAFRIYSPINFAIN